MLAPDWTWWDALPVVVAAALLLFVPGGVAAALVGLRPWASAAVAPLVTTTIVATGGVVASKISLSWSVRTFGALVVATWLLAAGARRLVHGRRAVAPTGLAVELPRWAAIGGLAVASLLACGVFLSASGLPGNIPQNPDMLFHLAVVERFLERGDISSLTATFAVPWAPGFYPAALHGLTATLVMLTGVPVVVAETSLVLVVAAGVWPLGVMVLARALLGPSSVVAWAAPVLALSFTSFPFTVLGWGPLWPFVLGMALLPAWLLLLVLGSGPEGTGSWSARAGGYPRATALVLLVATLPGLTLAHPNASVAAVVLGGLYLVNAAAVHAWDGRSTARAWAPLLSVLGAGVVAAVWASGHAPAAMLLQDWLQKPPFPAALATLAVLFIALAAVAASRTPRHWWIPTAATITLGVALVRTWGGVGATRWLTWPWYNDTQRIRALVVLPVVLAGVAAGVLLEGWLRRRTRLSATTAVVAVCGALLVLSASQANDHEQMLASYYRGTAEGTWVTRTEADALRRLSRILPDDAVVAANPLEGANFLQVLGPERVLLPSTQSRVAHPDLERLAAGLDTVGDNPEMCRTARRWRVTYAIVGGDAFAHADATPYAGVERVPTSPWFERVASAGPYTLYKMRVCTRGAR